MPRITDFHEWAFTGTQKGMTDAQYQAVYTIVDRTVRKAHNGDCVGSDDEFGEICSQFNVYQIGHPANDVHEDQKAKRWFDEFRPPAPALVRNDNMVVEAQALIATPRNFKELKRSGTWATIRYARKHGKPHVIIYPDGTRDWIGFD